MSEAKEFQRELADMVPGPVVLDEVPGMATFALEYGSMEAFLRGLRSTFLKTPEYRQLTGVEVIEDFKTVLQDTDYVNSMHGLTNPRAQTIYKKCFDKFVAEFDWIRIQSVGQLSTFIDFTSYEYLISNVVAIIAATVKGTPAEEVLEHCHPLGRSPYLKSMLTFDREDSILDLYRVVLVDMPVAKYFAKFFDHEVNSGEPSKALQGTFKEMDINVISDHLRKLWLEDFYAYCERLGGDTWTIMKELLEFEADRRAVEIVHNSIAVKSSLNDPNNRGARQELFCTFGKLYPECTGSMSNHPSANTSTNFMKVDTDQALMSALENYPVYYEAMRKSQDKIMSLSDALKTAEAELLMKAFDGQGHFACFYAFSKLKLIELENIRSIASSLSFKGRGNDKRPVAKYIPLF